MKIGIDGSPLALPFPNGTKHYAEQLLHNLSLIDSENEYNIFGPKHISIPTAKNFKHIVLPQLFPLLKRQLLLPLAIYNEKVSVFHYLEPFGSYYLNNPKIITTIHDVDLNSIYSQLHTSKYILKKYYTSFLQLSTIRNTTKFIAVSDYTKKELLKRLNKMQRNQKIKVIHEAPHEIFRPLNLSKNINSHYFLCMADFSPRKNISRLLHAFNIVSQNKNMKIKLKIVISNHTPFSELVKQIKMLKLEDRVIIIEDANLKRLVYLYNGALAFVYPSLYEGFGLPILEAMASGCPVITSNYGAMKETAGEAAVLVNPLSIESINGAMNRLINQPNLAMQLRKKGLNRSKKFSWKKTAYETIKVYETISNKKVK